MDAVLKALVEPHRRQILALIRESELPAGSIAERFRITRPAVSQHLAVLKQAGLVAERRAGTRRLYRLEPRALAGLGVFLDDLRSGRLDGLMDADKARIDDVASRERIAVQREIAIGSEREAVWTLLIEPEQATRWMGQSASFDLRVGGRYEVEVLPGLLAAGTFLEIEPPRRLVHTWGWELTTEGPVPPGSTIVVFDLLEAGGETRLRLSHRDLPGLDTAGSHSRGWAHYLARLAAVAEGNPPGPDPWAIDPERMRAELRPASGGSPGPQRMKGDLE